ncbi:MAG: flagellar motor protein MotD, partial [Nitrospira sp.]|nr:flagellar motor protein MotD [Nitrospira sp.]
MAKHKHEEHENHERWLVSYADFITLLFAFFVVMYSISSVNVGKYRTVSESIKSIKAALNPVVAPPASQAVFTLSTSKAALTAPDSPGSKEVAIRKLRNLVKGIKASPQLALVRITERVNGDIVITIPDQLLFNSGEAAIRSEALPFLEGV